LTWLKPANTIWHFVKEKIHIGAKNGLKRTSSVDVSAASQYHCAVREKQNLSSVQNPHPAGQSLGKVN
jgi:hypothetical protein